MRKLIPLALGLALAACAHVPPAPPAIKVQTVTVNVPVPVACVAASDIPAEPPHVGDRLNGDAGHDLDVVSASAIRLRIALREGLALLAGCVK